MILVIREKVTPEQLREMLEVYAASSYIKVAVDVEQEFLVGGAIMHYECEEVLLEQEECEQRNIWGQVGMWTVKRWLTILISTNARVMATEVFTFKMKT
jgi:Protein of unknown function (DUF5674)